MNPRSSVLTLLSKCAARSFPGIGGVRSPLAADLRIHHHGRVVPSVRLLFLRNEKVLHGQAPAHGRLLKLRHYCASPGTAAEKIRRFLRITDRSRQTNAARIRSRKTRKPFNQTHGLPAAVAAHQRMYFINDDEAQIAEKSRNDGMLPEQQCLERFRSDLENARRMLNEFTLSRLSNVSVPCPDGDAAFGAEIRQTLELIVDQRLERRDIKRADRSRRLFRKERQNREKGGFRFARGR